VAVTHGERGVLGALRRHHSSCQPWAVFTVHEAIGWGPPPCCCCSFCAAQIVGRCRRSSSRAGGVYRCPGRSNPGGSPAAGTAMSVAATDHVWRSVRTMKPPTPAPLGSHHLTTACVAATAHLRAPPAPHPLHTPPLFCGMEAVALALAAGAQPRGCAKLLFAQPA
jgi:hypothetical protein